MTALRAVASLSLVLLGVAAAQELTLEELERRGAETVARLERESAAYGFRVMGQQGGPVVEATVWSNPPDSKLSFDLWDGPPDPTRLLDLWRVGGRWVAQSSHGRGVYRPYEAVFGLGSAYRYLEEAEPVPYAQQPGDELVRQEPHFVVVRRWPDPEQRALAERLQAELDGLADVRTMEARRKLAALRNQLEALLGQGVPVYVLVRSGLLQVTGREGFQVIRSPIEWQGDRPLELRPPTDYPDRTAPLGSNTIMIGHHPGWRPEQGRAGFMIDGHLLDLDTQELRRIPLRSAEAGPGCFFPDRQSVVVLGFGRGGRTLTRVDLETGENRDLGAEAFSGQELFGCPTVSPDGTTLAVLCMQTQGAQPVARLHLLDLATDAVTPVGELMDLHSLSWVPDGTALIAVRRTRKGRRSTETTIVRLGLDGSVDELRRGDFAQVFGARILFRQELGLWYSCDLAGADVQRVGDGMPGLGFPAVSPDGTRALFMRYGGDAGPRPVIADLATGEVTPLPVGEGAWGMPAWR